MLKAMSYHVKKQWMMCFTQFFICLAQKICMWVSCLSTFFLVLPAIGIALTVVALQFSGETLRATSAQYDLVHIKSTSSSWNHLEITEHYMLSFLVSLIASVGQWDLALESFPHFLVHTSVFLPITLNCETMVWLALDEFFGPLFNNMGFH